MPCYYPPSPPSPTPLPLKPPTLSHLSARDLSLSMHCSATLLLAQSLAGHADPGGLSHVSPYSVHFTLYTLISTLYTTLTVGRSQFASAESIALPAAARASSPGHPQPAASSRVPEALCPSGSHFLLRCLCRGPGQASPGLAAPPPPLPGPHKGQPSALRCITMHCLTPRSGAKPRHSTHTPSLLAKSCTLEHLRTSR